MIKTCPICNKEFNATHYNTIYCSEKCGNEQWRKNREKKSLERRPTGKQCEKCGQLFIPKQHGATRRYCFNCIPDGLSTGAQIRHQIKLWGIEYKGNKCSICGYNKCLDALEFHHIDMSEKEFNISDRNIKLNWSTIKKELDKCILICCNCHREIHSKIGYNLPKEEI